MVYPARHRTIAGISRLLDTNTYAHCNYHDTYPNSHLYAYNHPHGYGYTNSNTCC